MVPAKGTSGKGRCQQPRQDGTQLRWLPVQHPARRWRCHSCPAFKWKQQTELLPRQLSEQGLLQEQTLCMQIKASRHNSLEKKKLVWFSPSPKFNTIYSSLTFPLLNSLKTSRAAFPPLFFSPYYTDKPPEKTLEHLNMSHAHTSQGLGASLNPL